MHSICIHTYNISITLHIHIWHNAYSYQCVYLPDLLLLYLCILWINQFGTYFIQQAKNNAWCILGLCNQIVISRLVKHNKILNQFCKLHFCKTLLFRVYYVALLAQSANCFKEEWRFELASNQINIIQLELVTLLTFWYIG